MESKRPVIQSVKLKGHQGAVLCLDHSSSCTEVTGTSPATNTTTAASLLSGSDDGTCRVWDLRASCRASLCIKCPGEVLSVAFGPKWQHHASEAATTSSPFGREYSIYTAVENNVYGYDLRNITSPIITEPAANFPFLQASDEINQMAFSPRRNRLGRGKNSSNSDISSAFYLATADDAGAVRVTDNIEGRLEAATNSQQRNQRVYCHSRDAMVTSLAFCPARLSNKHTILLASGGTDCCIQLWDILGKTTKLKEQPLCTVSIPSTDTATNQVCNPPMVHSLNWSPSGRLLAAGLGDGSVALLLQQSGSSSLVLTARLNDAHSGSVASCLFPEWTNYNQSYSSITAHDRLFCTLGNDGCIVLWDLGVTISSDKAVNPANVLQLVSTMDNNDANQKLNDLQLSNCAVAASTDDAIDQPQTLFAFQHTAKPNWMVSSRGRDPVFPSTLFVADVSNDITAYIIPQQ